MSYLFSEKRLIGRNVKYINRVTIYFSSYHFEKNGQLKDWTHDKTISLHKIVNVLHFLTTNTRKL